jgi:hypothetical protein
VFLIASSASLTESRITFFHHQFELLVIPKIGVSSTTRSPPIGIITALAERGRKFAPLCAVMLLELSDPTSCIIIPHA